MPDPMVTQIGAGGIGGALLLHAANIIAGAINKRRANGAGGENGRSRCPVFTQADMVLFRDTMRSGLAVLQKIESSSLENGRSLSALHTRQDEAGSAISRVEGMISVRGGGG